MCGGREILQCLTLFLPPLPQKEESGDTVSLHEQRYAVAEQPLGHGDDRHGKKEHHAVLGHEVEIVQQVFEQIDLQAIHAQGACACPVEEAGHGRGAGVGEQGEEGEAQETARGADKGAEEDDAQMREREVEPVGEGYGLVIGEVVLQLPMGQGDGQHHAAHDGDGACMALQVVVVAVQRIAQPEVGEELGQPHARHEHEHGAGQQGRDERAAEEETRDQGDEGAGEEGLEEPHVAAAEIPPEGLAFGDIEPAERTAGKHHCGKREDGQQQLARAVDEKRAHPLVEHALQEIAADGHEERHVEGVDDGEETAEERVVCGDLLDGVAEDDQKDGECLQVIDVDDTLHTCNNDRVCVYVFTKVVFSGHIYKLSPIYV